MQREVHNFIRITKAKMFERKHLHMRMHLRSFCLTSGSEKCSRTENTSGFVEYKQLGTKIAIHFGSNSCKKHVLGLYVDVKLLFFNATGNDTTSHKTIIWQQLALMFRAQFKIRIFFLLHKNCFYSYFYSQH